MLTGPTIQRILSGMNYQEYTSYVSGKLEGYKDQEEFKKKYDLLRLNIARSRRIDNTYIPGVEIKELISSINEKQTWMILTEPWCGDSAQNIPFIAAIASLNPLVDLKLILRDQNPDIMEQYLTAGARSIPILVAFDDQWNELFRWGSRPAAAKDLVLRLKEEGVDKDLIQEKLHTWYANNKGNDITIEMCEILRTVLTTELL